MGGYVERTLQPGETVVYGSRASKMALLMRPAFWLAIGLVAMWFVGGRLEDNPGDETNGWDIVAVIATFSVVFAVWGLVKLWWFARNSEYAVTDRRVVGKYGFLRTHSVDVMMTNIAGVTVQQRILGRVFNFGNVVVNGSGARRLLVGMKRPIAFQHAVYAQLDQSRLLKGTAAYTLDVRLDAGSQLPAPASAPLAGAAGPVSTASPSYCSHCGAALTPEARFCASCSAAVSRQP